MRCAGRGRVVKRYWSVGVSRFIGWEQTDSTFPSRIDTWLIVVVIITIGLMLFQAFIAYPESPTESLFSLAALAFMPLLTWLIGYPCEYTLTPTHLVIRSGVIRRRIAYSEVTTVEPSSSLWSAPALSLKCVKVSYSGRFQLLSPRDRAQFIAALRERVAAACMPVAGQ